MHPSIRLLFAAVAVVFVSGMFGIAPRAAHAQSPASAAPPETMKQAVTQADGITSRVVDKMWEETDHYWHEGDYNRIIGLVRLIVEIDPSFVEAYSSAAWLMWSQGDTNAADVFLKYGVANAPQAQKGEINYEFGWHLFNTKRYAEALPFLKKATDANVPLVTAYTTLGHCYRNLKRYDEAVTTWETVVKKFPNFGAGQVNLAKVKALQAQAK